MCGIFSVSAPQTSIPCHLPSSYANWYKPPLKTSSIKKLGVFFFVPKVVAQKNPCGNLLVLGKRWV